MEGDGGILTTKVVLPEATLVGTTKS